MPFANKQIAPTIDAMVKISIPQNFRDVMGGELFDLDESNPFPKRAIAAPPPAIKRADIPIIPKTEGGLSFCVVYVDELKGE